MHCSWAEAIKSINIVVYMLYARELYAYNLCVCGCHYLKSVAHQVLWVHLHTMCTTTSKKKMLLYDGNLHWVSMCRPLSLCLLFFFVASSFPCSTCAFALLYALHCSNMAHVMMSPRINANQPGVGFKHTHSLPAHPADKQKEIDLSNHIT